MSEWCTPTISDIAPPAPLIESHIDLRDRMYMPLLVGRLLDSEFICKATREEIGCAFLLWCAAWRQVPAGSLPNDDKILGNLLKFGNFQFKNGKFQCGRDSCYSKFLRIKRMVLWNFVLCSDGKFYHPVICEQAKISWELKQKQKDRTAAASKARWDPSLRSGAVPDRDAIRNVLRHGSVTDAATDSKKSVTGTKRREEKRREESDPTPTANSLESITDISTLANYRSKQVRTTDFFQEFWKIFPRKANRKAAFIKFEAAIKSGIDPARIIDAAARYAEACRASACETNFVKMPDTWLNKGCYEDEMLPMATARHGAAAPDTPEAKKLRLASWWRDHGLTEDEIDEKFKQLGM